MSYPNLFHLISTEFDQASIKFLLIGGFAVNAYGCSRVTFDVDILIDRKDDDKVRELFLKNRYEIIISHDNFCRYGNHKDDPVVADVLFTDATSLNLMYEEGGNADIQGLSFKIPSLNHLIAMKLHAIHQQPELRERKDLGDILELVKQNEIDVDGHEFMSLCIKYASRDILKKIQSG